MDMIKGIKSDQVKKKEKSNINYNKLKKATLFKTKINIKIIFAAIYWQQTVTECKKNNTPKY